MQPIRVNMFDRNMGGSPYSNMHWPEPLVQYIQPPLMEFDGITVFTDEMCFIAEVPKVKSRLKIAWGYESPVVKPHVHFHIKQVEQFFDYIYLFNPDPNNPKHKQAYFGACWVVEKNCLIYPKNKMLSIVASNKNYTEGHRLRHELIAQKLHPALELWGSGYRRFSDAPEERVLPFRDYRYVIVVENCRYPGYFTDKIIDCFATGCIPIYWGNPKMSDLFDKRGFYEWSTIEELKGILAKIGESDYEARKEFIAENYRRFRTYASPDRWMYDNCYSIL